MKILYLGTVCDLVKYEKLLEGCKVKPSVATIVFETALIRGFAENRSDVDILSYPMIPVFPKSRAVFFGGETEVIHGYRSRWLKTVNLPFVKQLTRRMSACRLIKKWAKDNAGNGVILSYSIPPFLAKDILRYSKKYSLKTVAIIPDLLKNMYINHRSFALINAGRQLYLNKSLKLQGEYDGYIYLTEAMREEISDNKPYIVMEGIYDPTDTDTEKDKVLCPRAIMYAGQMHKKYGVLNLVDAFEQLSDSDTELWLFGEGTAVDEILQRARKDCRIKYFGRVTREEVLTYEKKAALLVNPRSTKEIFTKYSFPSKTIEYMASGTPLLTTRLDGIPKEYFDYVFSVEDNDVEQIKEALADILHLTDEELRTVGKRARQFIKENKSAKSQAGRILNFLEKLSRENYEDTGKQKI